MGEKYTRDMKLRFRRLNKKHELISCTGELFTNSDGSFTFHFDIPAKGIVLNDGNTHHIDKLEGHIESFWIDREGLFMRAFVKINGKWHHDQLGFYYEPLRQE